MVQVKTFTAESMVELEDSINTWLVKKKPHIISVQFGSEGIEATYSVLIMYS